MAQSSKIKEDPLRIAKNSDMLSNAIDLLKDDRNKLIFFYWLVGWGHIKENKNFINLAIRYISNLNLVRRIAIKD